MGFISDAVTNLSDAVGLKEPLDDFADSVGDVVRNQPLAQAALAAVAVAYGLPALANMLGSGAGAAVTMGVDGTVFVNGVQTGIGAEAFAAGLADMGLSGAQIAEQLVGAGLDGATALSTANSASALASAASSSGVSAINAVKTLGAAGLQDPTTWGGVLNNLANVAGGAYLANESSSLFGDLAKQSTALGQDYANKIGAAGADAASKAQFKPYTVTSGLGGTSVTPEGLSYNLSPQQQAITDSLMSQAQNMVSQDAYVSPEGLFSTLQAMSDPVNARTRLAMENRLSAQGRLGTATAAYGGTPEQLAMEIAMQEQLAKNAWQSQIGAGQLTNQNLTNQGAALGTAYKPYDQMQGMMSQALSGQALAQNVGNTQAEIAYKTALAQAAAALEGQKTAMGYNTMGSMQNLGMMQGLIGQGANGTNNLVNTASGLFDLGKKVYSLF